MDLLDMHYAVLDSALRRTLVQSLILLRNRNQLEPLVVLPLFFRLFRCQDKQLRSMLFRHIVSDIKTANKGARNDKLNRALQSFMYGIIQVRSCACVVAGGVLQVATRRVLGEVRVGVAREFGRAPKPDRTQTEPRQPTAPQQDDNESAAKKSLAVCTELWRRHVWRDARTVNVIASATFHKSPRIMLAVLKFFMGQVRV
jgi:protein SDA1